MGGPVGDGFGNATAESLFATPECELINGRLYYSTCGPANCDPPIMKCGRSIGGLETTCF